MEIINEVFKQYIRDNLPKDFKAYLCFAVIVNRISGNPSFDISLDGTYAKTEDHSKSIICLCCNKSSVVCFIDDEILEKSKTANPPDKDHDGNWNQKEVKLTKHRYHNVLIKNLDFQREGDYEEPFEHNYFIKIKVRSDTILIDYKVMNSSNQFAGYIEKSRINN